MYLNSWSEQQLRQSLALVSLVALDVEGVLTDGLKHYGPSGLETMTFHARDGLGIHLLSTAGFKLALVTNATSDIIKARAADLGISEVADGVDKKGVALQLLKKKFGASTEQTLYVGDDLWDLSAFAEAGVKVAVRDAPDLVRNAADWVTDLNGGRGAVREVCDVLLSVHGFNPLDLLLRG